MTSIWWTQRTLSIVLNAYKLRISQWIPSPPTFSFCTLSCLSSIFSWPGWCFRYGEIVICWYERNGLSLHKPLRVICSLMEPKVRQQPFHRGMRSKNSYLECRFECSKGLHWTNESKAAHSFCIMINSSLLRTSSHNYILYFIN